MDIHAKIILILVITLVLNLLFSYIADNYYAVRKSMEYALAVGILTLIISIATVSVHWVMIQ